MELYKPIPNYPQYAVSNLGNVKNNHTNRILKPRIGSHGYLNVTIRNILKFKSFTVHSLVMRTFHDNPDISKRIKHIDKNKLNNNFDNLDYVIRSIAKKTDIKKRKRKKKKVKYVRFDNSLKINFD